MRSEQKEPTSFISKLHEGTHTHSAKYQKEKKKKMKLMKMNGHCNGNELIFFFREYKRAVYCLLRNWKVEKNKLRDEKWYK